MKLNLSFAILTAAALALAASPADAAGKKKSKSSSKAKVTVSQRAPVVTGYWASGFNNCASASATMWVPFAAVGTVGCGVVYAVPVMIEGFVAPRSTRA
jgi:hypothetical protein